MEGRFLRLVLISGLFITGKGFGLENQASFCANRTSNAWTFDQVDVGFDISLQNGDLSLKGYKQGELDFNVGVPESLTSFNLTVYGDFQIESQRNGLIRFSFFDSDSSENLSLIVRRNADVDFERSDDIDTGWNQRKIYGIKTSGILKNEGKLAFYALIAQASQILNYGTIMAGNGRFFQDYLFNSGVIQLGKIPETLVDLKAFYQAAPFAQARYQSRVIDNYGTIRVQGLFEIQTGGTYLEHGMSDFGNFYINGNIKVEPQGSIAAERNISGSLHEVQVRGRLLADRIDFLSLSHLDVSGVLQALSNAVLNVQGSVYNSGIIAAKDMTLHFKSLPSSQQTGLVLAQNDLDFQYESRSRPLNAPRITENKKYRDHLIRYAPDPEGPDFRRLLDEFYRSVRYDKDRNSTDPDLKNLPATIARRIKKVTIIDYYLNTITYTRDQYGRVIDVHETGYIWQKREKKEESIIKNVPAALDQDFMKKRASLVDLIRKQNEKLARAQEQGRRDLERRLQGRQQSFASKLARVLNDLRCSNAATRWLWDDPYFRDMSNWDNLPWNRHLQLAWQRPGSTDIGI